MERAQGGNAQAFRAGASHEGGLPAHLQGRALTRRLSRRNLVWPAQFRQTSAHPKGTHRGRPAGARVDLGGYAKSQGNVEALVSSACRIARPLAEFPGLYISHGLRGPGELFVRTEDRREFSAQIFRRKTNAASPSTMIYTPSPTPGPVREAGRACFDGSERCESLSRPVSGYWAC